MITSNNVIGSRVRSSSTKNIAFSSFIVAKRSDVERRSLIQQFANSPRPGHHGVPKTPLLASPLQGGGLLRSMCIFARYVSFCRFYAGAKYDSAIVGPSGTPEHPLTQTWIRSRQTQIYSTPHSNSPPSKQTSPDP
jgi:hypothetical protein